MKLQRKLKKRKFRYGGKNGTYVKITKKGSDNSGKDCFGHRNVRKDIFLKLKSLSSL